MPKESAPSSHDVVLQRREREARALKLSLVLSIVLAVGALTLGIASGTRIITFDGAYMSIGLILSWASLKASSAAAGGPTRRYPFGRDALAPLMVVIQGLALAGTLVLAVGDAVIVIRDGGSEISPLLVAGYGLVTGLIGFVLVWRLRRMAPGSDLVQAEAEQWRAGSVLSVIMVVGAGVVVILGLTPLSGFARFADPVLVLVACGVLATIPIRLIRSGTNELLEGAPPPEMAAEIAAAVEAVRERFALPTPIIRAGKVGLKVYVEVDFVVLEGTWDVDHEDEVRRAVLDELSSLSMDVWSYVTITTQQDLVE